MRVLLTQKMAGVAGSERYYLNLLPALRARGVDASFLLLERAVEAGLNDGFAATLGMGGVPVLRRQYRTALSRSTVFHIVHAVRQGAIDILQSNLIHADMWAAAAKKWALPGLPLVSAKHGYHEGFHRKHGLDPNRVGHEAYATATRIAATQADRVIAISRALANFHARARLIARDKIEVIPYGFSFDDAVSRLPPGGARFAPVQIVSVARLVPYKQHPVLLQAFAQLLLRHPALKLVVVGGGPESEQLKQLAQGLGIAAAVEWTGYVDNPHDYLRDSDLFVLPSAAEGFGAVILEAWHHALPVVAFDVPAPNEIVTDGMDGLLAEPYRVEALAAHIDALIADPGRRREMGRRGRETLARRFTIEAMTDRTIALYEEVLAAAAAPRRSRQSRIS